MFSISYQGASWWRQMLAQLPPRHLLFEWRTLKPSPRDLSWKIYLCISDTEQNLLWEQLTSYEWKKDVNEDVIADVREQRSSQKADFAFKFIFWIVSAIQTDCFYSYPVIVRREINWKKVQERPCDSVQLRKKGNKSKKKRPTRTLRTDTRQLHCGQLGHLGDFKVQNK